MLLTIQLRNNSFSTIKQTVISSPSKTNPMKILFTLLLFGLSITSNSQNLTVEEILSLRKKDIANVEEHLTAKGWMFLSSEEGKDGDLNYADFAYNKSTYNDNADSFLSYFYSETSAITRIKLQIHSPAKYNAYLARIKSFGCKLIDSNVSESLIEKVYQGATTTFRITIETKKSEYESSSYTSYRILIMANSDYELSYAG